MGNNTKVALLCEDHIAANTYIVYNDCHCIVIDPAASLKQVERIVQNRKVEAILLTHGHYDHFCNIEAYIKKYPVLCYMHKLAVVKLQDIESSYAKMFGHFLPVTMSNQCIHFLHDEERLDFAVGKVKVIATPGHTNCSVCYLLDNWLFTGDTLFQDTVGRTDLETGSAVQLSRSLQKLQRFPADYEICPGHGAMTSLHTEKAHNPYLLKEARI